MSSSSKAVKTEEKRILMSNVASEMKILADDLNTFQTLFCDIVASGQAAALNHGQVLDEMQQRAAALGKVLELISGADEVSTVEALETVTLGQLARRLSGEDGDTEEASAPGDLDLF